MVKFVTVVEEIAQLGIPRHVDQHSEVMSITIPR